MMDRDEAVKKLATAGRLSIAHAEDLYDSFFEKPVVPQFVADWYEESKTSFNFYLVEAINNIPYGADEEDFSDFEKWIDDEEESLITLVNMHQFGYEVEKEAKYLVKMKGIDINFNCLNRHKDENYWILSSKDENTLYQTHHTRKELESNGFGWVFSCEGIEIEEVE